MAGARIVAPAGTGRSHSMVSQMPSIFAIGIGVPELLVILAIVILIFGASRLPELGKGLGKGIKNFKEGMNGGGNDKNA